MRKIEVKNDKVLKALVKKDEMTKRVLEIVEESKKLEDEFNKLQTKLAREDENVRPWLKEEADKVDLAEFEQVSRVYLGKDGEDEGKVFIEIADRLEEFKVFFKKQKDEQNNSSDTNKDEGNGGNDTANAS